MTSSNGIVRGLGGVFLYANDPAALADWYAAHLGLSFACWGEGACYGLEFRVMEPGGKEAPIIFSIQKAKAPLAEGRRETMLNWRVDDLEAFLARIQAAGIPIEKQEDCEYGRFAWITDPEGHRLELYQPLAEPAAF
jgi:catechol 2,3-dioxygenase-like lactoylglutathione lyase family enzyme